MRGNSSHLDPLHAIDRQGGRWRSLAQIASCGRSYKIGVGRRGCCTLLLHGCLMALLKIATPGMIIFVSVSMFDHKPEHCPFGHLLWPGMAQVGCNPTGFVSESIDTPS